MKMALFSEVTTSVPSWGNYSRRDRHNLFRNLLAQLEENCSCAEDTQQVDADEFQPLWDSIAGTLLGISLHLSPN
ncbi:hypothetical protein [Nostoc sp.]|uniref:hypothetical protein n=1 Tax=Nostoc sp. TaxID=1180 RepID=UPI002FF6ED39